MNNGTSSLPNHCSRSSRQSFNLSALSADWFDFPLKIVAVLAAVLIFTWSGATPLPAQDHDHSRNHFTPDYLRGEEAQAAALFKKVLPVVVTIYTSQEVMGQRGPQMESALGSGVIISAACHVLTAAHVIEGAKSIIVKTSDDKTHNAELLFSEPSADIALIKLETPIPDFNHARLGNSDSLAVGQRAYVIGAPYGLEHSFSAGHISGFHDLGKLYNGTILAELIQTDAAINSGNSGGPVFNSQGEVIGIASRIVTVSGGFQGLGFVVAINTAKQLLALEGRIWIGIDGYFLDRDSLAKLFNRDLGGGLLVERVAPGSPADRAGLRGGTIPGTILGTDFLFGGDLILEFGSVDVCHSECLSDADEHIAGLDLIPVKFLRDGQILETIIDVSGTRRNYLNQ